MWLFLMSLWIVYRKYWKLKTIICTCFYDWPLVWYWFYWYKPIKYECIEDWILDWQYYQYFEITTILWNKYYETI